MKIRPEPRAKHGTYRDMEGDRPNEEGGQRTTGRRNGKRGKRRGKRGGRR